MHVRHIRLLNWYWFFYFCRRDPERDHWHGSPDQRDPECVHRRFLHSIWWALQCRLHRCHSALLHFHRAREYIEQKSLLIYCRYIIRVGQFFCYCQFFKYLLGIELSNVKMLTRLFKSRSISLVWFNIYLYIVFNIPVYFSKRSDDCSFLISFI